MELRPSAKVFLTTMLTTAAIFIVSCIFDWLCNENDSVFFFLILEGGVLLLLPALALKTEKLMKDELPAKSFLTAYFSGYATAAAVTGLTLLSGAVDFEKLFPHEFLGGIGILFMWILLLCGLVWAAVFRIAAAFCGGRR